MQRRTCPPRCLAMARRPVLAHSMIPRWEKARSPHALRQRQNRRAAPRAGRRSGSGSSRWPEHRPWRGGFDKSGAACRFIPLVWSRPAEPHGSHCARLVCQAGPAGRCLTRSSRAACRAQMRLVAGPACIQASSRARDTAASTRRSPRRIPYSPPHPGRRVEQTRLLRCRSPTCARCRWPREEAQRLSEGHQRVSIDRGSPILLPYGPRGEVAMAARRFRNHARKSPGVPTTNGTAWRNFALSRKRSRSGVTK